MSFHIILPTTSKLPPSPSLCVRNFKFPRPRSFAGPLEQDPKSTCTGLPRYAIDKTLLFQAQAHRRISRRCQTPSSARLHRRRTGRATRPPSTPDSAVHSRMGSRMKCFPGTSAQPRCRARAHGRGRVGGPPPARQGIASGRSSSETRRGQAGPACSAQRCMSVRHGGVVRVSSGRGSRNPHREQSGDPGQEGPNGSKAPVR